MNPQQPTTREGMQVSDRFAAELNGINLDSEIKVNAKDPYHDTDLANNLNSIQSILRDGGYTAEPARPDEISSVGIHISGGFIDGEEFFDSISKTSKAYIGSKDGAQFLVLNTGNDLPIIVPLKKQPRFILQN